MCSLACGAHGTCQAGLCACEPGWGGAACSLQLCHASCAEHGACVDGACVCQKGWNGRHCSLEGCGGDCGGHGECRQDRAPGDERGEWRCECEDGWAGPGCERRQETECQDEVDNDKGETPPAQLLSVIVLFTTIRKWVEKCLKFNI